MIVGQIKPSYRDLNKKNTSLGKRVLRGLFFSGLICGSLVAYFVWAVSTWSSAPLTLPKNSTVELSRGTGLTNLAGILESKQLVDSAMHFSVWVKIFSNYGAFKAGLYKFEGPTTPQDIAERLISGKVYEPIILKFTIPEGFTYKQISARLVARGVGSEKEFTKHFTSKSLFARIKVPGKTLEGFFFPATYSFVKKISAEEALAQGVKAFWENLPAGYEENVRKRGLSLSEAVNFASMIEKETLHDIEKPLVSEVIWRRLKRGEPLGIDAALIYGIKDYKGDIKWVHLRDKSNQYNTRKHKGLPPTPISSPGKSSLVAVLNPAKKGYNFYVADYQREGFHHFSKNKSEHNKYSKLYNDRLLKKRRASRNKRK